jgi:hypothetical protein
MRYNESNMRKGYWVVGAILLAGAVVLGGLQIHAVAASTPKKSVASEVQSLQELPSALSSIASPVVEDPAWLKQKKAAEAHAHAASNQTVTYDVTTRGAITASLAVFKANANATLNDSRGWAQMGVHFQEVASGGMFTLVLSEASQLPTFSSGCDALYSCNAGRYVVINQDRWTGATPSWNNAGGSLRDYQHMVINHETGHWLGHGHAHCGGAGQPAAVMQQQSIDLEGCKFNPWPLASELWSTTLGITL